MPLRRLLATAALTMTAAPLAAQTPEAIVVTAVAKLSADTTTARQRVEPVQAAPLSVTPIAADDFRLRASGTALPLLNTVPNTVAVRSPGPGGATGIFIRGLGSSETLGGIKPAVGSFVDGIYLRHAANDFGLFDVARVDVVRGSQGVLFGRNTSAGAVDVTLARPGDRVAGYAEGGYGQHGRALVRGSIDIPATAGIAVKLSGYYDDSRGVARNGVTGERRNDTDRAGLRGALRLKISDALSWNLAAAYRRDDGENAPDIVCGDKRCTTTALRRNTNTVATASPFTGLIAGAKAARGLGSTTDTQLYTSHLDLALGDATLSAITGFADTRQRFTLDFGQGGGATGANVVLSDGNHRQFSQELRLAGTLGGGRLDYVAGAVYFDDSGTTDFADVVTTGGVATVRADRIVRDETRATAGYVQLGLALTPALKLGGGVRYTDEKRRFTVVDARAGCATSCLAANLATLEGIWTPHASISFTPTGAVTLYASATRGYRSVGLNTRATTPAGLNPYASERASTYEAGAKTQFWKDRLRVNLTGFWLDADHAQAVDAFAGVRDAGPLRSRGVEIEVAAVPITGLSLTGSAGYQDAEYRATGARPAYAPRLTASAGASYDFVLPPRSGAIVQPAVIARYRSSFATTNLISTPRSDASVLVDAALTLRTDDGNWTLGVECLNCFDEAVVDARIGGVALLGAPRAWLIRARRVF